MGLISQIGAALFPSATAAPAVRKPVFQLQFGNASADDWAKALVGFSIESGFAPWVDAAEVYIASEQGPSSAPKDAGSISAGYDDASSQVVFTGQVESVRYGIDGLTRVSASNGTASLSRLRLNQGYEQSSAGDIVNDLAQKASVDTDSIKDGGSYPAYAIDDRRTGWQHIAALARNNGLFAYFSSAGKLNFTSVEEGQPVQTFSYGQDILAIQLTSAVASAGQTTVVGEGAAGSNGSDAWSWLLKDASSVKSQSGQGDPGKLVSEGSLRSSDGSQNAADSIAAALSAETMSGWLLSSGAPAVTVGSTIAIAGAPQDALNGTCIVQRVKHRFAKNSGFLTLMHFTKSGAGAGGAAGGLLSAVKGLL